MVKVPTFAGERLYIEFHGVVVESDEVMLTGQGAPHHTLWPSSSLVSGKKYTVFI